MKSDTMKARFQLGLAVLVWSGASFAATMNFSGTLRAETASYNNLGLGAAASGSKNYIAARALLNPNLVVDDHFSIKSQWSLLSSPFFTPAVGPLRSGQGSWIFGDPRAVAFNLTRVWLEWTSDIGVFRLGRMPVSWGYGMMYDSGDTLWDDFQSTLDRIEYRLHLGYVIGALAYSKGLKNSVLATNNDDQEFFSAYLRYDNPEVEVEAGLLFEKQQRSATQATALTAGSGNPYVQPGSTAFPNSTGMASPLSNNAVDLYLKKTSGYLTYGGEVSWLNGNAITPSGAIRDLNAFGVLLNVALDYRKVKTFLEFVYATGDADTNADTMTGFTLLHRNRRPGLILGRELLGTYAGNNVGLGTPVAYGRNNAFSGVLYLRPGVKIDWSTSLSSGLEVVIAQKASTQAGESGNLGIEFDAGTDYAIYKNFHLGADFGLLLAGAGIGAPTTGAAFALRATAALTF